MHIRSTLIAVFLFSALHIFAAIDSTGVQNNKGKKIIIHKVEAKETYYSLARKYNVDPQSIMDFNNNIPLKIGTVINIPTNRPFDGEESPAKVAEKTQVRPAPPTFVRHKVRSGETLSEIAEDFDTSVKAIQRLNNMKTTRLRIGQMLKVRQNPPVAASVKEPADDLSGEGKAEKDSNETKYEASVPRIDASRYGLREHTEHGPAALADDKTVDATKLLVLHRTAPAGTVMKITNPVTQKSTFAKVAGEIVENENTSDVIVVLTKAVADLIGATEKKFTVIIDYGLIE